MPNTEILSTFEQTLACNLSHEDIEKKGIELANLESEINTFLEDAKAQRASLRVQKNDLEAKRSAIAEVVRTGKEERLVQCALRAGNMPGFVDVLRMDTREVITTRRLKADESQGEMPFEIPDEADLQS